MKNVLILGATGTIGDAALRAYKKSSSFRVCGLVAKSNMEKLASLAKQYMTRNLFLTGGDESVLRRVIESSEADIVLNAISGKDGLIATVAAIEAGKDVALANKETIVMAGPQIKEFADRRAVRIIPVDSEHSSVYWLIQENPDKTPESIVITASGGPFRTFTKQQLETITPEMAVNHPTWKMGRKISVDSATLANKGLEVIEAMRLFNMPPEKIKVVVNPQSCLHGAVIFTDGSAKAAISEPDMANPIERALSPVRRNSVTADSVTLTFEKPDTIKFPMLALGFEVAGKSQVHQIAYNAADEVAVEAFLNRKIAFNDIYPAVKSVTDDKHISGFMKNQAASPDSLSFGEILSIDKWCREAACSRLF